MSKTIKIIDLLNRIANGEDVPEKIKNKYVGIMKWDKSMKDYQAETSSYWLFFNDCEEPTTRHLNDTVEIIEEQQDIDIQTIKEIEKVNGPKIYSNSTFYILETITKINELVQVVKQLDKNIKDKE